MSPVTVGSVCSGIGGLELAVALAGVDADLRWVAETAKGPATVLAARFPDVPNVGDWTAADLEPVDLIIGGLPCQPVSTAGLRAGTDDERWLFDDLARVASRMGARPRLFLENVRGLLSANGGDAMARIVQCLAGVGFVGRYGVLPASAVGACHRRERWFCLAAPDSENNGRQRPGGERHGWHRPADNDPPVADTGCTRPRGHRRPVPQPDTNQKPATPRDLQPARFDRFQPAVDRWASILGRPAPEPQDNRGRLNPLFVEWMMGYPAGWVTDPDLGLSRAVQLRCLGNAVVPQQAAAAWMAL